MKKLWPYLKPYRKQLVVGPFFKLLEAILELLIPTLMAYVIDRGVAKGDVGYILRLGGGMLGIAVLGLIFAYICQYVASVASQGFGTRVRNALFSHISTFSYRQLDGYGTSTLVNRITNDVNLMQQGVALMIRLFIRAPFICIGSFVMACIIDPKLSLVIFVSIPVFVLIIWLVMSRTIPMYKGVQKKLDQIAVVLRENLAGVRVIRAFARRKAEKARFSDANGEYRRKAVHVGKLSALMNPATMLIMNMVVLGILYFGGFRVNAGGMTQGEIIAFINYTGYMIQALVVLANLIVMLTRAAASSVRVADLLGVEGDLKDAPQTEEGTNPSPYAVEFRDVSFAYHGEELALEHISFALRRGQTLGIVGGTGAGKSTLVHLIPRFYDVCQGQILVDGVDVRRMPQNVLRKKIGLVMQKAVLFSGTIGENIRKGKPDATEEEVRLAAEASQSAEFIQALPRGYDSPVSRGGSNFSGGQKQRLSIARALVRRPQLLILDDSSSALDYATDARLRRALRNYSQGMSVILVAQRISSVLECDRILVLNEGRQVGLGTHEELLADNPFYQEICDSQMQRKGGGRS